MDIKFFWELLINFSTEFKVDQCGAIYWKLNIHLFNKIISAIFLLNRCIICYYEWRYRDFWMILEIFLINSFKNIINLVLIMFCLSPLSHKISLMRKEIKLYKMRFLLNDTHMFYFLPWLDILLTNFCYFNWPRQYR